MIVLGILLHVFLRGGVHALTAPSPRMDCLKAKQWCQMDYRCGSQYQAVEFCLAQDAGLLGPDGQPPVHLSFEERDTCVTHAESLRAHRHLKSCRCLQGSRREEDCLRVYWTIRFQQSTDLYDISESPYEDLEVELAKNIESSQMASMLTVLSGSLDGQNQCLKAAQDCGLYEKCGSLRSEYVLACTKRPVGSEHCSQPKCHRALRRFLERVPEQYSFGVLFCPCTETLCGERRRKTIVPSCSYQERDGLQPNCLHLQEYCVRDHLCRSRLADFQHNCRPSSTSPSACERESTAMCLKAYAGLIGTTITPNYVSNSSMEVALWCNCKGSGNMWQSCLRVQQMFTSNTCLKSAISAVGSSGPQYVDNTPPPPPRPSPLIQQDLINNNILPGLNSEELHKEDEDLFEEDRQFNGIPPFSEKATVSNLGSGARGGAHLISSPPPPALVLFLLTISLSRV